MAIGQANPTPPNLGSVGRGYGVPTSSPRRPSPFSPLRHSTVIPHPPPSARASPISVAAAAKEAACAQVRLRVHVRRCAQVKWCLQVRRCAKVRMKRKSEVESTSEATCTGGMMMCAKKALHCARQSLGKEVRMGTKTAYAQAALS
eukprot:570066-Pelagomonas_calceolata.AAC.7